MKDIKGLEGRYAVTKDGKIWAYGKTGYYNFGRWKEGRFLKLWPNNRGYLLVYLYESPGKKHKHTLVHRLVAETYAKNPKKFREVNHKNADKTDNRVENLEWCTSKGNKTHAWKLGLYTHKGEKHYKTTLVEKDIRKIRTMKKTNSLPKIAKMYAITPAAVSNICRRVTWKHIK